MAEIKTRADSLRRYYTGATSDGGAQTDPALSIGNYRSSTLETTNIINVTSPISGVSVDSVASANGTGSGTLTATGVNELAWTPPGGSQGAIVTIANGETKLLEGGGGAIEKFIIVTRSTASDLSGAATVGITDKYNSMFDDKTSAELSAGDIDYRCVCYKNESTSSVDNIKAYIGKLGTDAVTDTTQLPASGAGSIQTSSNFNDWPTDGFCAIEDSGGTLQEIVYYTSRTSNTLTVPAAGRALLGTSASAGSATDNAMSVPGIAIAHEAPSTQPSGNFDTPADESTAPTGPTFSTPYNTTDAISIGTLTSGQIMGLWIKRQHPAGSVSNPTNYNDEVIAFDAA